MFSPPYSPLSFILVLLFFFQSQNHGKPKIISCNDEQMVRWNCHYPNTYTVFFGANSVHWLLREIALGWKFQFIVSFPPRTCLVSIHHNFIDRQKMYDLIFVVSLLIEFSLNSSESEKKHRNLVDSSICGWEISYNFGFFFFAFSPQQEIWQNS